MYLLKRTIWPTGCGSVSIEKVVYYSYNCAPGGLAVVMGYIMPVLDNAVNTFFLLFSTENYF
ncbi:hypothetical protein PBI_121Q_270 [Escherichia phage 121Q]|uniref:Uncharacterized protein n=1 Tax=Escherichia phage 121Q TaxID=1555202 RepID=A0A097EXM5_9CAUD|nr:hypothetical protein PBI_121Q_270 [Escherichia phage 121Q]AIT14160.1 hypothetical protein PBI_121Q_270 [Escherichia phage 121Q]